MITDGNCTYQIQLCPLPCQCRRSYICASPGSSFHPFQYRSCNDFRDLCLSYELSWHGNADICAVKYLTPLAMQKIIPPYIIKKEHPVYADALSIFHKISQLYHAKPIGYELRIKSLLLELIALLLPFCQEDSAFSQLSNEHTSKLKAVLEFIEQHYADPLSVADLASVCCFSEYHFMRFFKNIWENLPWNMYGMSGWRKQQNSSNRVHNPRLRSHSPCGFNNLSYFHREFKEKYGMTPGAFSAEDQCLDDFLS